MILKLMVSKVVPGSYPSKKSGEIIQTLDLVCMDLGEGKRLDHAVLFGASREQKEQLAGLDLRDKVITVDVEKVMVNNQGAVLFRGQIDPASLPAANGPLKVEKPAGK